MDRIARTHTHRQPGQERAEGQEEVVKASEECQQVHKLEPGMGEAAGSAGKAMATIGLEG